MNAEPLRGKALAVAAINQIIEHPETWDQSSWHCGTSHCFLGHCQILAGEMETQDGILSQVTRLLGVSLEDAMWLSDGKRSLSQLYAFVKNWDIDRDGFDRDGFDRDGFDRDGFDRDGFDRRGFDRYVFDRDGFGRRGFDRDGFDRYGFDCDGNRLPLLTV